MTSPAVARIQRGKIGGGRATGTSRAQTVRILAGLPLATARLPALFQIK
jgi:hypothetical protein